MNKSILIISGIFILFLVGGILFNIYFMQSPDPSLKDKLLEVKGCGTIFYQDGTNKTVCVQGEYN